MGVPLARGRVFTEHDRERSQKVVLVNEAFARSILKGEDPIGQRVGRFGDGSERVIVGVVRDFKQSSLDADVRADIYTPQAQTPWFGFRTVVVRSAEEPARLVGALGSEVRAVDPSLPATKIQTMDTLVSNSFVQPRFRTLLLSLFAGVALLLAAVGIYGVMAYSVSQRVKEIGIRMALGARWQDVLALIVGQGMKLALAGVVIGTLAALALTQVLRAVLFQTEPTDPITFAGVTPILLGFALLGSWLPARRATKIPPTVALRYE
jgi:putative ABC transport system permease protein